MKKLVSILLISGLAGIFGAETLRAQMPVDLGLSVKWGSCNLGAASPGETGDYYAWGEVEPKTDYSWQTYKWCNGTKDSLTKYNRSETFGAVDNKVILDPDDDAARVKLGGMWRMPTPEEWQELYDSCTWQTVIRNGIGLCKVTSKINGNYIFFPRDGHCYWSSSLLAKDLPEDEEKWYCAILEDVSVKRGRREGRRRICMIRPVIDYKEAELPYKLKKGDYNDSRESSLVNVTALDFGLSVKWGSSNLGADSQNREGKLYAWGELTPKSAYKESNYKWESFVKTIVLDKEQSRIRREVMADLEEELLGEAITPRNSDPIKLDFYKILKYNTKEEYGKVDNKTRLLSSDDAAHSNLGSSWRIPTKKEIEELSDALNKNGYELETTNPYTGGWVITYLVNGNRISIPDRELWWTSLLSTEDPYKAQAMSTPISASGRLEIVDNFRYTGNHIRPVCSSSEKSPLKCPEAVDLGLSVKWASFNLGATGPEYYGNYYAWGELTTKSEYTGNNYNWYNRSIDKLTKYNSDESRGLVDNKTRLEPEDDVARAELGGRWRIPTAAEWHELIATVRNPDYRWTATCYRGTLGCEVLYLKNGNRIFFPASGMLTDNSEYKDYTTGFYWTSDLSDKNSINAISRAFQIVTHPRQTAVFRTYNWYRFSGCSIRAVTDY